MSTDDDKPIVPASGHELSWEGIAAFRIADRKIVERWFNSDSVSIVRQLGRARLCEERRRAGGSEEPGELRSTRP